MKGFVKIDNDNWRFVNASTGKTFIPYGVNYFDPETGWAPNLWKMFNVDRVNQHFSMMSDIGVNVTRVFLTAASFQPDIDKISDEGLEKLDTLIEIARKFDIRLILTGPDHWEGFPSYWHPDKYAGEPALNALRYFWNVIAERYRDEEIILAWDLINEPGIPWKTEVMEQKWRLWDDESDIPEDKINTGNKLLYNYQLFRESIAYEWVKTQVDAIHCVDTNHLITVGLIQWSFPLIRTPWGEKANQPGRYSAFNPKKLASLLDFISIHFYPILGDPGDPELARLNTLYLQAVTNYCYTGKPVVLEEFGWHGGGEIDGKYRTEAYQSNWNTNAVLSTIGLVSGWLVWAFSDTPTSTDLTKYGGLYNINGELKEWGKSFKSISQKIGKELDIKRRSEVKQFNFDECIALTGDVHPLYDLYIAECFGNN